jgi:hypothetical protein
MSRGQVASGERSGGMWYNMSGRHVSRQERGGIYVGGDRCWVARGMVLGGNLTRSRRGGVGSKWIREGGDLGAWEGATLGGAHGGETTFPEPPPRIKGRNLGVSGKA